MTFTLEPHHVYLGATTILAILQIYQMRKLDRMRDEISALWQQLSIMAIATGTAFDKIDKKIDGKGNKPTE